ncbi:MlaC/ttg2D family ABC transporter substrate-binding protein [Opacimonas viscosa]|uniref:ABC transporter substrate-binding protein n=1 Tax=Opacimonas viscosa TaxID=2961944 RepID=A0AA42BM10_9ALTE|nr:ABC transporter substrate-binding protein [Opacimonas viscosa]MCP3429340.1 ABC transporter substrate-binding protein [Opacimonas viscosa]
MLRFLNVLALCMVYVYSSTSFAASEQEEVNPYEMIQTSASTTFARMKEEQEQIQANPEHLRTIMRENLLPNVDYRFAAFMTLGNRVKTVPEAKRNEFVEVFREYLVTTYANALGYYDDQSVIFEPAGDYKGKRTVTIRAVIQDEGRPDIKVAFKVRFDRRKNKWGAYDMVAEGISLLSSQRSEFETILRQDGIDTVIALMQEKINQPIVLQNGVAPGELIQ